VVASTPLVPGYVGEKEVEGIARFVASLDPATPYAFLAFHPVFAMSDLSRTTRHQAARCVVAARAAGLRNVRLGNVHLLA